MCIDKYLLSDNLSDKAIGITLLKVRFQKPYEEVWDLYHELIDNKGLDPDQFPFPNQDRFIVSSLVKRLCNNVIPELQLNPQAFTKKQIDEIFDEALSKCC